MNMNMKKYLNGPKLWPVKKLTG